MTQEPHPLIPAPHDASYKALFMHVAMIKSLIIHLGEAFGLPPEFAIFWDISKAEVVSAESISRKLKRRANDLIIKIPARCIPLFDGIPLTDDAHIAVEFQSQPDPKMPERMMRYLKNLFRRLWMRAKRKGVVPQLLCFVLYHGKPPWPGPKVPLVSLYDNNRPGMQIPGAHPERRVNLQTLNVDGMPEDALVPALCRIEQAEDIETVRSVLKTIFTKYSESDDAVCEALYDRAAVIGWFPRDLETRIPVPYKEAKRSILGDIPMPEIVTTIDQMMHDNLQEGLQKGRQEGRQEGLVHERKLLQRLTASRFDADTADRLGVLLESIDDPDRLEDIGEWIVNGYTKKKFLRRVKRLTT